MTKATPTEVDFSSPSNSQESERHGLQVLIASELVALKLPSQRFDIQASFLAFDPMDLGIRLVWPVAIQFQGKPTGVIQIGNPLKTWSPESRVIIAFARLMSPERLRKEIRDWCMVSAAIVREALEGRGGTWPRGWPRLKVGPGGSVNDMPVKAGTVTRAGRLHK